MTGWVTTSLCNYCKSLDVHSSYWSCVKKKEKEKKGGVATGVAAVICSESFQMSQLPSGHCATYEWIFHRGSLLLSCCICGKRKWGTWCHSRWHPTPSLSPEPTQWPVACCHSVWQNSLAGSDWHKEVLFGGALTFPVSFPFRGSRSVTWVAAASAKPPLSPVNDYHLALWWRSPENESLIQEMKLPWAKLTVCKRTLSPHTKTNPYRAHSPSRGIFKHLALSQLLDYTGDKWIEATNSQ